VSSRSSLNRRYADRIAEDIDNLPRQLDKLPEPERLAVQVVQQLVESAYTVTDE
jgi:hypothetical protein